MSNSQLIVLLVIIIAVYLLFKKDDPYSDFKKWLDRHPQLKSKLGQKLCDEFFIRPGGKEAFDYCWETAINFQPIPDNLLPGNKILIPLIQTYLREQKGLTVNNQKLVLTSS